MIKIFACVGALVIITLMSSCAKAKVKGVVCLTNVLISKYGGDGMEFTTEGKNLVLTIKVGPVHEEKKGNPDFRNSLIEYYKNDSSFRYVTEDLFSLCKEADYEYFIARSVDSISGDTMNITIPIEAL